MKQIRPTFLRSVSNTCRQKEKTRCQMCSGDRWWKRRRTTKRCGNDWESTIFAWDVGILPPRKKQSKEFPRAGRRRKAGRNTRSVAAGIASQRVLGKCCHDTDCNEPMMKEGFTALKNGNLEEFQDTFRKKMKASEWASDRKKKPLRRWRRTRQKR